MSDAPPPLDLEKVKAFVANAHGDLEYVREALADEPALVNAGLKEPLTASPGSIPRVRRRG